MYEAICIFWESVKPGLISTYEPYDQYSIHLSESEKDAFIAEHQNEHLITTGKTYDCEIEESTYQKIKASKNGIWSHNSYPMGQKKDFHWEPVLP